MRQRKTVPKGWLEDIVSDGVKKWVGYFHIRENNERKKKQITLGQCSRLTKTDANKMLEKHIADVIERQNTTIVKDITVEEIAERWLSLNQSSWKEDSYYGINCIVSKHVIGPFGKLKATELTRMMAQTYLDTVAKNRSKELCRSIKKYLKAMFEEAIDDDIIACKNPIKRVRVPVYAKVAVKPLLTIQQLANLLDASRYDLKSFTIMVIGMMVGLRPGEIFALRVNDIKDGCLNVDENVSQRTKELKSPKTKSSTTNLGIADFVYSVINRYIAENQLQGDDFLFLASDGGLYRPFAWVKQELNEIKSWAGMENVRVNFQIMRRSFSTILLDYGNLKDIQSLMRHANPDITAGVYMQSVPESAKLAANKMTNTIVELMQVQ